MVCARCAMTAAVWSTIIAPCTPSTSRRPWRMGSSIAAPSARQHRFELLLERGEGVGRVDEDSEDLVVVDRDQARALAARDRDALDRPEPQGVAAPGDRLHGDGVHGAERLAVD